MRYSGRKIIFIKARQWGRSFTKLFYTRSIAPIKDQSALLTLLSYPIFYGLFSLLVDISS